MSMNEGWGDATMAAGTTGAIAWHHPAQIAAGYAGSNAVELDAAPQFYHFVRKTAPGGLAGVVSMTVTATGFTLTSTHPGETGTFRAYARVRELPQNWQA